MVTTIFFFHQTFAITGVHPIPSVLSDIPNNGQTGMLPCPLSLLTEPRKVSDIFVFRRPVLVSLLSGEQLSGGLAVGCFV